MTLDHIENVMNDLLDYLYRNHGIALNVEVMIDYGLSRQR